MVVPNNEGKVCDAVVRVLEKWTNERHADIRHPDMDGGGPPVDLRLKLGAQEYAIEHTRIESHENQIGAVAVVKRIICHIKKNIPDPFPSLAYYELQFPIDVSLPKGKAKRDRALNNLVEWIRANEQILRDRNAGRFLPVGNPYMANDYIRGTPAGFDCEFDLLHWQVVRLIQRRPRKLSFRFILPDDLEPPDDLEGPRAHRLRQAFSRKCPKASGVQDGRGANHPGAGKQRLRFHEPRIPRQAASFVANRVHECARRDIPGGNLLRFLVGMADQTRRRPLAHHGYAGTGPKLLRPRQIAVAGHTRMVGQHTQRNARRLPTGQHGHPLFAGMVPCYLRERRVGRPDGKTNREKIIVAQLFLGAPFIAP